MADRQAKRGLNTGSKAWRTIRKAVLTMEPLCRHCGEAATDVDHIDGDTFNNHLTNLMPLCKSCHSRKTAQEQAGKVAVIPGCDVTGWPLDPNHPWNADKNRQQPRAASTRAPFSFGANRRLQ
ncbi:HNH endonuclease signature motif containing protein [Luteimonas sp. e5]